MIDEHDEFVVRLADALRPLPAVDDEAKARVLLAVAAERERDRTGIKSRPSRWSRRWIAASGIAVAAAMMLMLGRSSAKPAVGQVTAQPANPISPSTQLAAADPRAMDAAAVPVQLVFRAPDVARVAVVGDFNGWNKDQDFMTRDTASGLWSATLRVRPGRHVYAFVVNDTQWVRDPRAVAAPDADFGRPGSVLLVSKP